jgi:hypothetical protein
VNKRISLAALMALKEVGMMSDDALVVQYLTREAVAKIPHSNIRMILSDVLKDRNWSEIDKLHSKTQSG